VRRLRLALCLAAVLASASETRPVAAPGASPEVLPEVARDASDPREAILDGGSTIGLIPLGSPTAARSLRQYLEGFFRDEDARGSPVLIPSKAARCLERLADYRGAGATHLILLYHDGVGDVEYVRLLLVGRFNEDGLARLEAAGLGHRGAEGAFELCAFKDGAEVPGDVKLPALPVARLTQMVQQLAAESDCAVDFVALARKDAAESYLEAVKEAFAEEGQAPEQAVVPSRALQVPGAFAFLRAQGATHVVVTAFQNQRGADIVLIVAKGVFGPEALAKLRATYSPRVSNETTVVLQRWVDGEEKGAPAATPAIVGKPAVEEHRRFPKK
jgi:hypothetical protein